MIRPRIHILYEHGVDLRPHGSASLRLIRPFSHPVIREKFFSTFSREVNHLEANDIVIVDRLWKNDISPQIVEELSEKVHQQGGKLMYWFDDNFLEIVTSASNNLTNRKKESFTAFLERADALVVTTPALASNFEVYGKPVFVIPNAIDERLIVQKQSLDKQTNDKVVIGYMGTGTHDEDLEMVLPALQAVHRKYPDRVRIQIVGALDETKRKSWDGLNQLPVTILNPLPAEIEYALFMVWFTGEVFWDIAIAPLADTKFNQFKSDIKFLDYSAAGIPGVYSNTNAYTASVEDRNTGLLLENGTKSWIDALDEMIRNESLRKEIACNAKKYLYEKRILSKCAENWISTMNSFIEKGADA